MKKLIVTVCLVLGLVIMAAPMAMAEQVSTVGGFGPYQTGRGGEFTLLPDAGLSWVVGLYSANTRDYVAQGTFQTFCVEDTEYIWPNTTYDARISDHSIFTNFEITKGAAYLYHQFQIGQLQGYDYATRSTTQALQDAIWYFMGVGADPGVGNVFRNAGFTNGGFANNDETYPVAVLNLWVPGHVGQVGTAPDGYPWARQDMLVCVPESGILILLGIAMSAIGMAYPFVRKI